MAKPTELHSKVRRKANLFADLGRVGWHPLVDGVEALSEVPLDLQRVPVLHGVVVHTVQQHRAAAALAERLRHPHLGDLDTVHQERGH